MEVHYPARSRVSATLALLLALAGLIALISSTAPGRALGQPVILPFSAGETWYVCQGYNGQITHQGKPDLDLSVASNSAGSTGCTPATNNASTGRSVFAPVSGKAYQVNSDMVCINATGGGSVLVGHMNSRPANGASVVAGQTKVGVVNPPGTGGNGGYAHIHLQAHSGTGCGSSPRVPFSAASQARFECAPDLASSGARNQWAGTALTRCAPAATETQLANGSTLGGQSVALNQWKHYFIDVPSGTGTLTIRTTNASADVDLYTRPGTKPDTANYACRPYSVSGNETCTHNNPASGRWWFGVRGYAAGSFSITATLSTTTAPPPPSRSEVIVDDRSGGFSRSGSYWWESSIGYSSHMYWTYVNGSSASSSGQWSASLGGGRYEVYVFIPRDNATSQQAQYQISHTGGTAGPRVNQNSYYDAWVSVGTYEFSAGTAVRVRLTDATGEAAGSYRKLGFDAIKFVPR